MPAASGISTGSTREIAYVSTNIQKASQIPQYCMQLAEMFEKLPLFEGSGSIAEKCKVIPLERWDDARICDIFSENASRFLGNKLAWHIHDFGCGNHQLFDSSGRWIKQGVSLCLYDDQWERCSLETLQDSYNQVFQSMVTGWAPAKIEDNPGIMLKENSDDFMLFIREKSLREEDFLIGFIASRLSMQEDVKCGDKWLEHPYGFKHGKSYLWIRKSALDDVVDKFGFQFS